MLTNKRRKVSEKNANANQQEESGEGKDFIGLLPFELSFHIVRFLPSPKDICLGVGLVNHQWASIAKDNHLWKILYFDRWSSYLSNFVCVPRTANSISNNSESTSNLESEENWLNCYSLRQTCNLNWKKKNILHSTSITAERCQEGAVCILPNCQSVATAHVKINVINLFSGMPTVSLKVIYYSFFKLYF